MTHNLPSVSQGMIDSPIAYRPLLLGLCRSAWGLPGASHDAHTGDLRCASILEDEEFKVVGFESLRISKSFSGGKRKLASRSGKSGVGRRWGLGVAGRFLDVGASGTLGGICFPLAGEA